MGSTSGYFCHSGGGLGMVLRYISVGGGTLTASRRGLGLVEENNR